MKQKCPECKSIIEIDEKKYQPEENVAIICPLCETTIIFSIPKLQTPKPKVIGKIVIKKTETLEHIERIKELEQEICKLKENEKSNSNIDLSSSTNNHHPQSQQVTDTLEKDSENGMKFIFIIIILLIILSFIL